MVADAEPESLWERHAGWWQEHFTDGADPEYEEQILPLVAAAFAPGARVLDVGCGEGQVARRLVAAGVEVVGVEPTAAQVSEAARRWGPVGEGAGMAVVQGGAERLPFADGSFDGATVVLVFEHVADMDAAIAEVARVLCPGGDLLLLLNHPLLQTPDAAWVDDQVLDPPERYWRVGPYLPERAFVDQVERGVFIPFFHRPLSRYVNALVAAGLVVVGMDEPAPPAGFLARADEYREAADIPRLLVLRARRTAPPAPVAVPGGA